MKTGIDKTTIINQVLKWGLGAVLMIIGAASMIFHNQLNMEYPIFLWVGIPIMIIGSLVWLVGAIFDFIVKLKKLEIELPKQTTK